MGKYKVALQCGHGRSVDGSWDCGTAYGGYTEAALMLPITKSAVKYLRSYGVTVISDADKNNNRNMISDVRWANSEKCDIYVSVHCDYYKAPSGVMPLYVSSGGKKLATALNNAVKSGMGMRSRGVVRRTDLWELNGTNMVACILETGSIKADIKTLKKVDAYGKCIAKGICDYLGVKAEDKKVAPKPAPTPKKKVVPAKKLYRVRASWNEPATQVGAFTDLENAKQSADVNHLNVYASNGKLVYSGKKKETISDKVIKACKDQIATMKKTKYGWRRGPTVENTKEEASCVSYGSVVFQRVGALKSGECIWHNGKGYGTGKVYIWDKHNEKRSITTEDPMDLAYMGNKTISSLKSKLKIGDMVLLDDNKSGEKGSGGHEFILAGWDGDDPLVWDMEPNRKCIETQKPRTYSGSRKVLARVRLKGE